MKRFLTIMLVALLVHLPVQAQNSGVLEVSRVGHGSISGNIALSPDGNTFALSTTIGTWVYNTRELTRKILLASEGDRISRVAWSPDGTLIAALQPNGLVQVWDALTNAKLHSWHVNEAGAGLAWSPDSTLLAISGEQGIHLWNRAEAQPVLMTATVARALAWSPDGTLLAAANEDDGVTLWNPFTAQITHTLNLDRAADLAWSGDLLAVMNSSTIFIWSLSRQTQLQTLEGSFFSGMAFSPNGIELAVAHSNNLVQIWDATTGVLVTESEPSEGSLGTLAWLPTAPMILVVSTSFIDVAQRVGLYVWNYETNAVLSAAHSLDTEMTSVSLSPNRKQFVTTSFEGVHIWDVASGTLVDTPSDQPHCGSIWVGTQLVMMSGIGELHVWDSATDDERFISASGRSTVTFCELALSPDQTALATVYYDTLQVWHLPTWGLLFSVKTDPYLFGVAWSPDGHHAATVRRQQVVVWNTETQQQVMALDGEFSHKLAWSGDQLATGTTDGAILILQALTGETLFTLQGPTRGAGRFGLSGNYGLAWSGNLLLTAGLDDRLWMWDVTTREVVQVISGHTWEIADVVWSPDGEPFFATASADGTARVWRVDR